MSNSYTVENVPIFFASNITKVDLGVQEKIDFEIGFKNTPYCNKVNKRVKFSIQPKGVVYAQSWIGNYLKNLMVYTVHNLKQTLDMSREINTPVILFIRPSFSVPIGDLFICRMVRPGPDEPQK